MSKSNISSVTRYFPTVNEGFTTTLGSTITAGAAIVPFTSMGDLDDGSVFVGMIEPGTTNKEQVFTGTVDLAGVRITGVKWTRGSNVDHGSGVTIVDYPTGTGFNMLSKGIRVALNDDGTLKAQTNLSLTTPKILTSLNDTNGNELFKVTATSSAVNELTIANAATGSGPTLTATGGDPNIDVNIATHGTGVVKINGNPISSGAWTAYTPTWTASTSNPAIGNGTMTGKYTQNGKTITAKVEILFGSTTTKGTGNYSFSLPVTSKSEHFVGGGVFLRAGAAFVYGQSSNADVNFTVTTGAMSVVQGGGLVGSTTQSWTTGDIFVIQLTYEAA